MQAVPKRAELWSGRGEVRLSVIAHAEDCRLARGTTCVK